MRRYKLADDTCIILFKIFERPPRILSVSLSSQPSGNCCISNLNYFILSLRLATVIPFTLLVAFVL